MKSSTSENNLASDVSITSAAIKLTLIDGRVVHVPLSLYPTLQTASDPQRRDFKVMGDGEAIHWPQLDLDLTVEGMVRGWGEAIPAPPPLPDWARSAKGVNVFPIQDGGWGVSTGVKMKNITRYQTCRIALDEAYELARIVGAKRVILFNERKEVDKCLDVPPTPLSHVDSNYMSALASVSLRRKPSKTRSRRVQPSRLVRPTKRRAASDK